MSAILFYNMYYKYIFRQIVYLYGINIRLKIAMVRHWRVRVVERAQRRALRSLTQSAVAIPSRSTQFELCCCTVNIGGVSVFDSGKLPVNTGGNSSDLFIEFGKICSCD